MADFFLRTESIKDAAIADLSVLTSADKDILSALKSQEPCLLEGARGTGKTFLMRLAEYELEKSKDNYVTVFLSFNKSSLISTGDSLQFYHWMLAKVLKALLRKLKRKGLSVSSQLALNLIREEGIDQTLEGIVEQFENSYKIENEVDTSSLPEVEEVKDVIKDICDGHGIKKIFFFFDEAAHVFRPEQQRQFFTLFKDLRSPYIVCNAAIYPGVTHFGDSFELIHDCVFKKIEKDILSEDYVRYFREIVVKQSDDKLRTAIEKNEGLFATLAFAAGGNPRMLLRTIQALNNKFTSSSVDKQIKDFYRSDIWKEHTSLGEKYKGHKEIVDWGRLFLEDKVIPEIEEYNKRRKINNKGEATIYFWIHKDSPETVKESLRLLTYTGIIRKMDDGVKATRSELGIRYEVKYGCMLSLESNPSNSSKEFFQNLSIKKFPEFGRNHPFYEGSGKLLEGNGNRNGDFSEDLLKKPISVLVALTVNLRKKLEAQGIHTIEDLYHASEERLKRIHYVGDRRARNIKNTCEAEILEYISG